MPDDVDDHAFPNPSILTSMNEFTSICDASPIFNTV